MNSPADDFDDELPNEGAELDDASLSNEAQFEGDTGTLAMPARRVLVRLIEGPSLDARRHERLWMILKTNEAALRSRLHDIFLELIVDDESRVAFCRQILSEEVDPPKLMRRQSLNFIESALMLYLRQRLLVSDSNSERAAVDHLELIEHLKAYERSENVDISRFGRQMDGAIEKAKKIGVLLRLSGSEGRYEISPTLRLLFSAEQIQQLAATYQKHAAASADRTYA